MTRSPSPAHVTSPLLCGLLLLGWLLGCVPRGGEDAGVDAGRGVSEPDGGAPDDAGVASDAGSDDDAGEAADDAGFDAGREPIPCVAEPARNLDVGGAALEWEPLVDGAPLPSWLRPQGGVGTRVSALLDGWDEAAPPPLLRVQLFGPYSDTPCTVREDCGQFEYCAGDTCRVYIVNQTYGSFDAVCLDDGTLFVRELEVLFRGDMSDAQLDDMAVEVVITAEQEGAEPIAGSATAVLDIGPFIQPSWWDH